MKGEVAGGEEGKSTHKETCGEKENSNKSETKKEEVD